MSAAAEYGPRENLIAPAPALERGVAGVLSASPDGKLLAYGNGTTVVVRSVEVRRERGARTGVAAPTRARHDRAPAARGAARADALPPRRSVPSCAWCTLSTRTP